MRRRHVKIVVLECFIVILLVFPDCALGNVLALLGPDQENHMLEESEERLFSSSDFAYTSSVGEWPMAGANPQRTSWTSEEVRGELAPIWYRVVESYIPPKVQIIAAEGLLFISTANGLYALDADTGETAWVYPTELPLGNSPTVFDGVVYVGGFDHKLHAIDVQTGAGIWTYDAGAGFETNPLVLDIDGHTIVYVGNRDEHMYAIEDQGSTPHLLWIFETEGPILFSAAYRDNTIYFASNDAHAYALNARTGGLVWKSAKLPGAGFQTWWPVLYQDTGADVVILAGSNNYRHYLAPSYGSDLQNRERDDIFPDRASEPRGTPFGTLYPDLTIDATRVLEYFEEKPWRRTYFVLDRTTGEEIVFDFDGDGMTEYAPILWHGTHSGNRYPPIVGADGLLYQSNTYMSDPYIPAGQVSGWVFGTPEIIVSTPLWKAMDEPLAYSAGGNVIYWSHCNDRSAGAFDISIPNDRFFPEGRDPTREWVYFDSTGLVSRLPGYNVLYEGVDPDNYGLNSLFRGTIDSHNGIYGQDGHQNPPIPYAGRVYLHRSNAVIAFGDYSGQPIQLPMAEAVVTPEANVVVSAAQLRQRLVDQVRKILDAGHLRPGYRSTGLFDGHTRDHYGDHMNDYWHQPSDILYTLILALPYLPSSMQQEVRIYLQNEYATYPPYLYTHIGWKDGAAREPFDLPQEVENDRVNHPPGVSGYGYDGWTWPPQMFYALWKYAIEFGDAQTIFDLSSSRLESPPLDAYLIEFPYIHNAYIAGYIGYLELESLAGYPESSDIRAELTRLQNLRIVTFDKDTPYTGKSYARTLSVARNFMYLVPELGQQLHDAISTEVQEAVDEYEVVAPYWFVSDYATTHSEGANQPFYDYYALFQAKALILQESGKELVCFLDMPAVQIGDLYYMQNLVAVLEAGLASGLEKTVMPHVARTGDTVTYTLAISGYEVSVTITDTLPSGVSAPTNIVVQGSDQIPVYDSGAHQLIWHDDVGGTLIGQSVSIQYATTVLTSTTTVLRNAAVLTGVDVPVSESAAFVIVNPYLCYLPLVVKD